MFTRLRIAIAVISVLVMGLSINLSFGLMDQPSDAAFYSGVLILLGGFVFYPSAMFYLYRKTKAKTND